MAGVMVKAASRASTHIFVLCNKLSCDWWLQRINGRLAMIGFVATAAAEAATHKSALEQIQIAPIKFTITMFLISLASLIPKYASGTSLAAITQACSRDGMPPQLR